MKVEQIYTKCLSQASYIIDNNGECAVIDPLRDVDYYIKRAKKNRSKIKYILQTHFHADFVSGHLTLSKITGAKIIYGPNADPKYEAIICKDGDIFSVGNLSIKVIHTPGHTLESVSYLLFDEEDKPNSIFTGDTLFLGDVGIPDVAQRYMNLTKEDLAGTLFDSINIKIKPLDENLIVYPGHGAGSACGKNMMKATSDTLKNQKLVNYSMNGTVNKNEFIKKLTDNLPEPPAYFPSNVILNKDGYDDIDKVIKSSLNKISNEKIEFFQNQENVVFIDTRKRSHYIKSHIKGSIFIGLEGRFAPWVGELLKSIDTKIIVVCSKDKEVEAITRISRIGFDKCIGFIVDEPRIWKKYNIDIDSINNIKSKDFIDILKVKRIEVIDVRSESEYKENHIESATNIPLSILENGLSKIDKNSEYYIHCAGGYRSIIAISILKKLGYEKLINIQEGFKGIRETNLNISCFNSL